MQRGAIRDRKNLAPKNALIINKRCSNIARRFLQYHYTCNITVALTWAELKLFCASKQGRRLYRKYHSYLRICSAIFGLTDPEIDEKFRLGNRFVLTIRSSIMQISWCQRSEWLFWGNPNNGKVNPFSIRLSCFSNTDGIYFHFHNKLIYVFITVSHLYFLTTY